MLFNANQIVTLYKNDYGFFTKISKKERKSDEWRNYFIRVVLSDSAKSIVTNKCKIQLLVGRLTFNYSEENDQFYPYIYVESANLIEDLTDTN